MYPVECKWLVDDAGTVGSNGQTVETVVNNYSGRFYLVPRPTDLALNAASISFGLSAHIQIVILNNVRKWLLREYSDFVVLASHFGPVHDS